MLYDEIKIITRIFVWQHYRNKIV